MDDKTTNYDPNSPRSEGTSDQDTAFHENSGRDSQWIGPYHLLEKIGEGGMGTVWMAEQNEPVRRRVAIKLIKPGIADKQIIARFEAERQALAMMDHQNIARVLDAGTTNDGNPFFVMELVNGVPISEYCNRNKLNIAERLELFIPVCKAIQHAHHKGIIHRDIKPSNILVGMNDGVPTPKVIDFGLAKAIQHTTRLTDKTMFTAIGRVVGTVQYMSPEQADSGTDIDARTDIYSLGAVLYELLAGSTPIDKRTIGDAAILKVLELVREKEPPRPSTRLVESADSLASISNQRKIQPAKLQQILRGELDWIVMKSLEKDRNRRYETANGFAVDIQRYLDDEPVQARPASFTYRSGKFIRKNRGLVAALATISALLIGGLTATSWFAWKAEIARDNAVAQKDRADTESERAREAEALANKNARLADQRAEEARENADRADTESERAREAEALANKNARLADQRAEEARENAVRAETARKESDKNAKRSVDVLKIVTDAFRSTDPNKGAHSKMSAKHVLLNAQLALKDSELDDEGQTLLRSTLTNSLIGLGEFRIALETAREDVEARTRLHGPDDPVTDRARSRLAIALAGVGKSNEGIEILESLIAKVEKLKATGDASPEQISDFHGWRNNLGAEYLRVGKVEKAIRILEEEFEQSEIFLGSGHIDTIKLQNSLANAYRAVGKRELAVKLTEQCLAKVTESLGRDHPTTLTIKNNLANFLQDDARFGVALKMLVETFEARKLKLGKEHPDTIRTMNSLGGCLSSMGRIGEALAIHEEEYEISKRVFGEDHPDTLMALNALAVAYDDSGRHTEAIKIFGKTMVGFEKVYGPLHPESLRAIGNLAAALMGVGETEAALPLMEKALAGRIKTLGRNAPETLITQSNLSSLFQQIGQTEKAIELRKDTLRRMKKTFGPDHPNTLHVMTSLANSLLNDRRSTDDDRKQAVELLEISLEKYRALFGLAHPSTARGLSRLRSALASIGDVTRYNEILDEELEFFGERLPVESPEWHGLLAVSGAELVELQEFERAKKVLRECLQLRKKAAPDSWLTFDTQSTLGEAIMGLKEFEKAEGPLRSGFEGLNQRVDSIPESFRVELLSQAVERLIKLAVLTKDSESEVKWKKELAKIKNVAN